MVSFRLFLCVFLWYQALQTNTLPLLDAVDTIEIKRLRIQVIMYQVMTPLSMAHSNVITSIDIADIARCRSAICKRAKEAVVRFGYMNRKESLAWQDYTALAALMSMVTVVVFFELEDNSNDN
jgi:hypothetical protein